MVVFIGCPTSESVNYRFVSSLLALTNKATQNKISSIVQFQEGNRTDRNRNLILEKALETDWDYMLWLDTDMVYPDDLIEKYLDAFKKTDADVLGCLYFKRKYPYAPIGFEAPGTEKGRFKPVHPDQLKDNQVIDVLALGYGGMMVKRQVYDSLGEDKWTRYGYNFHKPQFVETEYGSHDVMFCQKVIEHGFKVKLHGGVRPLHIATMEIGIDDWRKAHDEKPWPTVSVIMPTIHVEEAQKTAKILMERADYPHKMLVVEDIDEAGFVAMANQAARDNPADYYVYLTDDIFPSRGWLKTAMIDIQRDNGVLMGFNDGKWNGLLATCGLVKHEWMVKNYEGNLFFPAYFGHYNDTELTVLAMSEGRYCYNPNNCLTEVDYDKDTKKVNISDKKLFNQRKQDGFDKRVSKPKLLELFS